MHLSPPHVDAQCDEVALLVLINVQPNQDASAGVSLHAWSKPHRTTVNGCNRASTSPYRSRREALIIRQIVRLDLVIWAISDDDVTATPAATRFSAM